MEDTHERLDVDEWLRDSLQADPLTARRLAASALLPPPRRRHAGRWVAAAAAVATLGFGVAVASFRHARIADSASTIEATRQDDLLLVHTGDGRRWIVGPESSRVSEGDYAIVVPASEEK